jgi:hypothetical protein
MNEYSNNDVERRERPGEYCEARLRLWSVPVPREGQLIIELTMITLDYDH